MREKLFVRTHAKSYLCRTAVLTSAVLCALSSLPVGAHGEEAPNSGFTQAYVSDFERVSKKIMDLAAAMPEETFNWRPAEGVRSVSQNFMHIANANIFFSSQLGVDRPDGLADDLETITDKAEVLKVLGGSMEQLRKMAEVNADEDLEAKEVDLFGNKMSARTLYFIAIGHLHEHLGLAIAYARSNGVVPPWSRPRTSEEDG